MLDWIRRTLGLPPRKPPVEATTAPPSKPDRGEDPVPVPPSEVSPAWDDPRLKAILPHREVRQRLCEQAFRIRPGLSREECVQIVVVQLERDRR